MWSVNQVKTKSNRCENHGEKDALIERDWAVKCPQLLYHDSQSKRYGKRGLNWQMSVSTFRKDDICSPNQFTMYLAS